MLHKYDRGASKHVYDIVIADEWWIYSYEPESIQQSTVGVFPEEPNITKVARAWSTSKHIIACFFGKTGLVSIVSLQQSWTEHFFASYIPRNQEHQPPKMDYSSPRQCEFSHIGWNNCIFEQSKHPDLAPNDFCLFPYVKNKIRGQRFSTPEEALDAFRMHVLEIPQS